MHTHGALKGETPRLFVNPYQSPTLLASNMPRTTTIRRRLRREQ